MRGKDKKQKSQLWRKSPRRTGRASISQGTGNPGSLAGKVRSRTPTGSIRLHESADHVEVQIPIGSKKVKEVRLHYDWDTLKVQTTLQGQTRLDVRPWANSARFQVNTQKIRLPEKVDIDYAKANSSLKNGMLKIQMPKVLPGHPETKHIITNVLPGDVIIGDED